MRVISGIAKGIKLESFKCKGIRPTTDKVKQAIFNTIQFDILNSKVLDIFSGTGQFGIEALSRGASFCTFVDSSKKANVILKNNIKKVNLSENAEIINLDAIKFVEKNTNKYDIIFLDPPYKKGFLQKVLPLISNSLSENFIVICEHAKDDVLEVPTFSYSTCNVYNYGSISFTVYRA